MKRIFFLISVLSSLALAACPITLVVKNLKNYNRDEVYVVISGEKKKISKQGTVEFAEVSDGPVKVSVFYQDKMVYNDTLYIKCQTHQKYEIEISDANRIDEVYIRGKKKLEKLKETPLSVKIVDMQAVKSQANNIGEILNMATGIKLRTEGGIGSGFQVNLGGLQGKAVRIFRDGVPIEFYGHSFNPNVLSPNMLDRVDVYKGVMPIALASDALGGGINFISKPIQKDNLEISSEMASFSTYKSHLNAVFTGKKDSLFYIGTQASYVFSKNNYKILGEVIDQETANLKKVEARRFHDDTEASYMEVYTGVRNKSWANDFRVGFIYSHFYKEIQNDLEMRKPYGEAFARENNVTGYLQYKKMFFDNRLKLDLMTAFARYNNSFVDISRRRYNWLGEYTFSNENSVGEINKGNDMRMSYNMFYTRLNAVFRINNSHSLEFGNMYFYQRRKGSDPYGAINVNGEDVLKVPAIYNKNIAALGLVSHWLDRKVETIIGVKNYFFSSKGYTTDKYNFTWESDRNKNASGYMAGISYKPKNFILKLSYEKAVRLPDETEIFGDGILIRENLDLEPEKSDNVNLVLDYTSSNYKLNTSLNLFYRNVKNTIFMIPDNPYGRYQNYYDNRVLGLEYEINYQPIKNIQTGFNITYQDIRLKNLSGSESIWEDARQPNIPYLFGNHYLRLNFSDILKMKDKVELYYNINYVHRFLLYPVPRNLEPGLFSKANIASSDLLIPNDGRRGMVNVGVGITYFLADPKLAINFSINNLTNERLYDNYNAQKPTRSYHLKLTYTIF
ncbi:TonB-dependent receptor [Chryseobacterium bernardetii]|uniref:TonB-dependent receptor n=1 Tax=Chryseobacterium bernardetii TaxID=1241978 RepID=UPI0030162F09